MFKDDKPIYKQIKELVKDNILKGKWKEKEKIPSVRSFSSEMSVNPNTIMRAFRELQDEDILLNKRGIGNLVKKGAKEKIFNAKIKKFEDRKIKDIIKTAKMLDMTKSQLVEIISNNW